MRKALCVGINYYEHVSPQLDGCVNDAEEVQKVLSRHEDGTVNFDVKLLTSQNNYDAIQRNKLKSAVKELFQDDSDIALFYFSGHGYMEDTGGYLVTSDCEDGDDGLPLSDLLNIASCSPAKNKILIIDCCHSGCAGNVDGSVDFSLIKDGMTILSACRSNQVSLESNGRGIFTTLLIDALCSAMNLVGDVTPGSVYAHIDQSLGPWEQRPIFKTNVSGFVSLRKNKPPISLDDLHKLVIYFPEPSIEHSLDPTYEPESDTYNEENGKIFRTLQNYNRVNLVVPVGADHMYFAAMEYKSCKLTRLGIHYWNLVKKRRI